MKMKICSVYYDLNQFAEFKFEYDLFRNIEDYRECLKNDIIGKITEIRNEFLSNFKLSKMENEIKVEDIIKLIFEGKSELLFNETKDFLKVFIQNTNNVIEKNFNLDLVKMFGNKIKKIHALIEFLETSSSLINQYHLLKIPKHSNIEEYINDLMNGENYYLDINILNKFEKKLPYKDDIEIGYIKSEIKAEACFIFLVKVYIKETQIFNSIIKDYENAIITNIVYEDIDIKLNEINKIFEERLKYDYCKDLMQKIQNNFFQPGYNNNLNLERTKYILGKILKGNIVL